MPELIQHRAARRSRRSTGTLLSGAAASARAGGGVDFAPSSSPPRFLADTDWDSEHIHLDLEVDPRRRRLAGTCRHTVAVLGEAVAEIAFDAVGFRVTRVAVQNLGAVPRPRVGSRPGAGLAALRAGEVKPKILQAEPADGRALSTVAAEAGGRRGRGVTPHEAADPVRARFTHADGVLRVRLPQPARQGSRFEVTIDYRVEDPGAGMHFRSPEDGYPEWSLQAWTQGQSDDARCWFPCRDVPEEKATAEFRIRVPSGFVALANGEPEPATARRLAAATHSRTGPVSVAAAANPDRSAHSALRVGRRTGKEPGVDHDAPFVFVLRQPTAMYLFCVVVGQYEHFREEIPGLPPLDYWVPPGKAEAARRGLRCTAAAMAFFQHEIGVDYPYPHYGQVVNSGFGGGMENATLTNLTDAVLLDRRAALDVDVDALVAHELVHHWFGDLVTCRDWSHAWLHESFATFYETLFIGHDRGDDEFWRHLTSLADAYFDEARTDYCRPIVTRQWPESFQLFDRHLYQKGACILHYWRRRLGADPWRRAIRHWLDRHRFGPVTTADLVAAVREVTGVNLEPACEQWLFRPGHPEFRVTCEWLPRAGRLVLSVVQTQARSEPKALYDVTVVIACDVPSAPAQAGRGKTGARRAVAAVPGNGADGGLIPAAGCERHRFTVRCQRVEHRFEFALPSAPVSVVFDADADLMLKKVDFVKPAAMWRAQLRDPHPVARAAAIEALGGGAGGPPGGAVAAVAALVAAWPAEPAWWLRARLAAALGRLGGPAARAHLEAVIDESHPKVRRAVVAALAGWRDPALADVFLGICHRDPSVNVAAAALRALAGTGDRRIGAAVEKALATPSWVDTLATAGVEALTIAADHAVDRVAGGPEYLQIDANISQRSATVCDRLWQVVAHPTSERTRACAIRELGRLGVGDPTTVARLVRWLDDRSHGVRVATIGALVAIGHPAALSHLTRRYRREPDSIVRGRLERAIRELRLGIAGEPPRCERVGPVAVRSRSRAGAMRSRAAGR